MSFKASSAPLFEPFPWIWVVETCQFVRPSWDSSVHGTLQSFVRSSNILTINDYPCAAVCSRRRAVKFVTTTIVFHETVLLLLDHFTQELLPVLVSNLLTLFLVLWCS